MSLCSLPDNASFMHTNNERLISNFQVNNMYSIRFKRLVVSSIASPPLVKAGPNQGHLFWPPPLQSNNLCVLVILLQSNNLWVTIPSIQSNNLWVTIILLQSNNLWVTIPSIQSNNLWVTILLLVKQRRRVIELKKSAELELEEIKKNSPGVFLH